MLFVADFVNVTLRANGAAINRRVFCVNVKLKCGLKPVVIPSTPR
jgi:hypothetical protein